MTFHSLTEMFSPTADPLLRTSNKRFVLLLLLLLLHLLLGEVINTNNQTPH